MLMQLAVGAALLVTPVQGTDTTFAVNPNLRLDVSTYAGLIIVRTWDRNEIRLQAEHSRRDRIVVDRSDTEVRIRPASWARWAEDFEVVIERDEVMIHQESPRMPSIVDLELTVPATMALELGGPFTDVTVEGSQAAITIQAKEGDIVVRGGRGRVTVRLVEGDVTIEDVTATVRATTLDGDLTLANITGDVTAETTDGEIWLDGVRATNVEAYTVDGDIRFEGTIAAQGLYSFLSHDGDVTLYLPPDAGARVMLATLDGDFTTDFGVTLPERHEGRRVNFTLGDGGAEIEIETFDGDVEVLQIVP
ncbi:MAG: DUF4097 family beta strand repeat-containing protein [Gemmatimonadales bacterium]|jgi:hypothetical protein